MRGKNFQMKPAKWHYTSMIFKMQAKFQDEHILNFLFNFIFDILIEYTLITKAYIRIQCLPFCRNQFWYLRKYFSSQSLAMLSRRDDTLKKCQFRQPASARSKVTANVIKTIKINPTVWIEKNFKEGILLIFNHVLLAYRSF